jgi:flagellar hook-associated protein 3 FlgL
MRISTANSFDQTVDQLQRRQADMSETQMRLVSGKRVNKASDDPAAAARAERALANISRTEAQMRATEASRSAMELAEGSLGDATELLQQAREAMVASGNASYTDAERQGLANKIRALRSQLLAVANRSDGANGYVFGGQGSAHPPFVDLPGGVAFRGVGGELTASSGEALPLTIDGNAAWLSARTGNGVFETQGGSTTAWIDGGRVTDPTQLTGATYTVAFSVAGGVTTYSVLADGAPTALAGEPYVSGRAIEVDGLSFNISGAPADGDTFSAVPSTSNLSVFDALDRAAADLELPLQNQAQRTQAVSTHLRNIDSVMNNLIAARAAVGESLTRADSITDRHLDLRLQNQTNRSNAEDLDMVKAISDFEGQQAGYDAALKSYSMVQRMSLFQYIGS